jgi:hypothetical protein
MLWPYSGLGSHSVFLRQNRLSFPLPIPSDEVKTEQVCGKFCLTASSEQEEEIYICVMFSEFNNVLMWASHDSSLTIVGWMIEIRLPSGAGIFFFAITYIPVLGPLSLLSNGYRRENGRSMKLTTPVHLMTSLGKHGAVSPHSPRVDGVVHN